MAQQPENMDEESKKELFLPTNNREVRFYKAHGCAACKFTGYNGRIAIHKIITISETLRKLLTTNVPIDKMRQAAADSGYRSMRSDGIKKVLRGLTSIEEVNRVAFSD